MQPVKKIMVVLCLSITPLLIATEMENEQVFQNDQADASKNLYDCTGCDSCKCPCNQRPQEPKPQKPTQTPSTDQINHHCAMMLHELQKASDFYKCPCSQRPQAPKPQKPDQNPSKKVLKECCKVMLEEAVKLSDMQLAEDIAEVMNKIEKMDENKALRPESEPFIVGPGACSCNNEQLLECCNQQLNALQNLVNLVTIAIDCVCANNPTAH